MLHQRFFHFKRTDGVARADDDIVAPAFEPEIAVLILARPVSGNEILPVRGIRLTFRVFVIILEQGRHA
ncbi:hypothetical protein D3C72_2074770 [compost metagenome]